MRNRLNSTDFILENSILMNGYKAFNQLDEAI
jgi:hypothetical protein